MKFIVPYPTTAVGLRNRIKDHRRDLRPQIITIAHFIKEELKKLGDEHSICTKNELMLQLATEWKKCFPSGDAKEFFHCFDLFCDLRGISVDFSIVEDGLKGDITSKETANALRLFWNHISSQDLWDEHWAAHTLAEKYRSLSSSSPSSQTKIVLYGFSYLTPEQCYLVQIMGEMHSIFLPFPARVYKNALPSDWIKWVGGEVVTAKEDKKNPIPLKMMIVPKRRLGWGIKFVVEEHLNGEGEVLLGEKSPTLSEVGEIPLGGASFKVSTRAFKDAYQWVFNHLFSFWGERGNCSTKEVLDFLQSLEKKEMAQDFGQHNFTLIKTIKMVIDEVKEWKDLSKLNDRASSTDGAIWQKAFAAQLPLNFIVAATSGNTKVKIKGLEELDSIDTGKGLVVGVSSGYTPHTPYRVGLIEKIVQSEFVSALGPIRRRGLEDELLQAQLIMALAGDRAYLAIEKEVIEKDFLWDEILNYFTIQQVAFPPAPGLTLGRDFIKLQQKKKYPLEDNPWSASRIQAYLDCPRSFYYKYIEAIPYTPRGKDKIEPHHRGELTHRVIGRYLNHYQEFINSKHEEVIEEEMKLYLQENGLNANALEYQKAQMEIRNHSRRGIDTLLKFKEYGPDCKFFFEQELNREGHRGQIDCIVQFKGGKGIFDFKRSVIPSKGEVNEYKKIQLWYYCHTLTNPDDTVYFLAYLCLKDLKKSKVVFNSDCTRKGELDQIFTGLGMKITDRDRKSFVVAKGEFSQKIQETINAIEQDREFFPQHNPECNYCWLDNICEREKLEDSP